MGSFVLADVGASGGISKLWHVFGDALRATGFDPLIGEVARLNNAISIPASNFERITDDVTVLSELTSSFAVYAVYNDADF